MEVEPEQGQEQEPRHPFEVFPAELWELVLSEIEDPKDRWNAAHAHPLFRNLLMSNRESWMSMLFGLALPQLMVEEHLRETKDILAMRQVGKGWSNSMDKFLENRLDQGKLGFNGLVITNAVGDNQVRNVSGVLAELSEKPEGKIIGGQVRTLLLKGEDMEDVHSFFQQQGDKIFHFRLLIVPAQYENGREHHWSPAQALECLQQILETTPNLKTLELGIVCTEEDEHPVVQYLQQYPLPVLPHLVSLKALYPTAVTESPPGEDTKAVYRGIYEAYLSQLQHLSLIGVNIVPVIPNPGPLVSMTLDVNDLAALEDFRSVKASLETLGLNLAYSLFCQNSNLVFELLEQFGESLRHLRIFLNNSDHSVEQSQDAGEDFKFPGKINLPGLQTFAIYNHKLKISSATGFDFLLNFPKLRELELEVSLNRDAGLPEDGNGNDGSALKLELKESVNGKAFKAGFAKECRIWERLAWLQKVDIRIISDGDSDSEDTDRENEEEVN